LNPVAFTPSFKLRPRYVGGAVLVTFAAAVAIGLVAPFVDGARFSAKIQQTLETTLGRKIQFERVRFTLFSGPGFSLENVTIGEDPRFGIEPFAFVPVLRARVRLDKLLMGEIRFSSFRMEDPSLNLVKRNDGTWNAVELVERLTAPRRTPLNLFPVFEVSGGRIDFKFETRKTAFYMLDADLSIYPERSGKLSIRFAGFPARTDRAGNGFAHLRGNVDWFFNRKTPGANQLRADLVLDPSNLGELTTLVEGHDIGLHGTVSTQVTIQGSLAKLAMRGDLRLVDVHRWDLLPANGEDWRVQYGGEANLLAGQFRLKTFPTPPAQLSPIVLEMAVSDVLKRPQWLLDAHLEKVPVRDILPLGRRMGLALPPSLGVSGTVGGVLAYTSDHRLNGSFVMQDVTATLPEGEPTRAEHVSGAITDDRVHFDPTIVSTAHGTLQAGGTLFFSERRADLTVNAQDYPIDDLKAMLQTWVGSAPALDAFKDGRFSGNLAYSHREEAEGNTLSGRGQFSRAVIALPNSSAPLEASEGTLEFDNNLLDITRLSSRIGAHKLHGSYRYNTLAKRREHLRVELASADLNEVEELLSANSEKPSWLARLGVTGKGVPKWIAERDMEGDIDIASFSVGATKVGSLSSRFVWRGTNLDLSSVRLKLMEGSLQGHGTVELTSSQPQYDFVATASDFPWRGGFLGAEGHFQTFGVGENILRNLQAAGNFGAKDLALSSDDFFSNMSGGFRFSFADGWPNLHLSEVQAEAGEDDWKGEASSDRDGKLIFDLEHAGRQRRVVSNLIPEGPATVVWLKQQ